jgi:DNA-directed RNA polymerase subunit RPC12/RpoP
MTPTSDERREVAERLRNEGRALTAIDMGVELASLTLDDAIGIEHNATWEECFDRLADLIDPTCHIVCVDDTYNTPKTGRVDQWHYECSKCGIELDDNDTDAMDSGSKPFDYCPYCGARVVNSDE